MTTGNIRVAAMICLVLATACAGCGDEAVLTPGGSALEVSSSGGQSYYTKAIPPEGTPHGTTYAAWSTAWWQWLLSAPVDVNPALDETGEDLAYGQEGPVWYIASNFGGTVTRNAVVPSGTALLVEVASFFASTRTGDGTTEAELRAAAAAAADNVAGVYLAVDGVRLSYDLPGYRVQSPEMFGFTLPEDNLLDYWGTPTPAGTYYPAVSDGWFVMLAPLAPGMHTIEIMALVPWPTPIRNVTINLMVGDAVLEM